MIEANAQLLARAQSLLSSGRAAESERLYRQLLQHTHVIDFEYDEWLKGVADCYRVLQRTREAGYVFLYLHAFDRAAEMFPAATSPVDAARVRELQGRRVGGEQGNQLYAQAARGYAEANRHVLAAIAYAQANSPRDERRAWERVLRDPRLRGRMYEEALVHFNVGIAAIRDGDKEGGNRHLVSAQRLLEEVADEFETKGERHRAFDCYCILLKLGKDSSSFENLAEGYINCIRVLKEDNLKFYVLQYYEDFLRIALEREEYHAAATVFREAADYARRVGLIYDRGYMKRAAETWWKAAEKNERDGGPVEITENAYLAAIDSYNSVGDFFHVRESYKQLAKLGLGEKKQKRYSDVVARYSEVWQEAIDAAPFPDYLRQQHAYPEIWYLDLVEWELDGDHREVCATIIGDTRYADIIRRRALNVLLTHLDARPREGVELDPHTLAQIAQDMGQLQAYAALQPLERLSTHPHPEVRRGVMRALKHLFFKRTFNMIQRGLKDEVPVVRQAALEALKALHFPHAFDPLTRIFREHDDPTVKEVALESIARIGSLEAGEFLVEVLRYEAEPLRQVARRQLAAFDNPDIFPILRKHLELETAGPARQALEQIVRAAGARAN
ncbi:MAG: lyase domain protein repeat-containing protein [Myxococcales bacterium]|nr:lyase domain protein repeat-containing protein [Myxococcales bacterium]